MRMISNRWMSVLLVAVITLFSGLANAQSSSSSSASSGPTQWGPAPAGYVECARNGQVCSFSGTRVVLIDNCFETLCGQRTVVGTGSVVCSVPSRATRCSYSLVETTPVAPLHDLVATASTQSGTGRLAAKAVDGDTATRWEASNTTPGSWLQLKRSEPFYLSRIEIAEFGERIRGYRIEYLSGSAWGVLQEGMSVGSKLVIDLSAYGLWRVQGVRIVTTGTAAGQPSVIEFSVSGSPVPASQ